MHSYCRSISYSEQDGRRWENRDHYISQERSRYDNHSYLLESQDDMSNFANLQRYEDVESEQRQEYGYDMRNEPSPRRDWRNGDSIDRRNGNAFFDTLPTYIRHEIHQSREPMEGQRYEYYDRTYYRQEDERTYSHDSGKTRDRTAHDRYNDHSGMSLQYDSYDFKDYDHSMYDCGNRRGYRGHTLRDYARAGEIHDLRYSRYERPTRDYYDDIRYDTDSCSRERRGYMLRQRRLSDHKSFSHRCSDDRSTKPSHDNHWSSKSPRKNVSPPQKRKIPMYELNNKKQKTNGKKQKFSPRNESQSEKPPSLLTREHLLSREVFTSNSTGDSPKQPKQFRDLRDEIIVSRGSRNSSRTPAEKRNRESRDLRHDINRSRGEDNSSEISSDSRRGHNNVTQSSGNILNGDDNKHNKDKNTCKEQNQKMKNAATRRINSPSKQTLVSSQNGEALKRKVSLCNGLSTASSPTLDATDKRRDDLRFIIMSRRQKKNESAEKNEREHLDPASSSDKKEAKVVNERVVELAYSVENNGEKACKSLGASRQSYRTVTKRMAKSKLNPSETKATSGNKTCNNDNRVELIKDMRKVSPKRNIPQLMTAKKENDNVVVHSVEIGKIEDNHCNFDVIRESHPSRTKEHEEFKQSTVDNAELEGSIKELENGCHVKFINSELDQSTCSESVLTTSSSTTSESTSEFKYESSLSSLRSSNKTSDSKASDTASDSTSTHSISTDVDRNRSNGTELHQVVSQTDKSGFINEQENSVVNINVCGRDNAMTTEGLCKNSANAFGICDSKANVLTALDGIESEYSERIEEQQIFVLNNYVWDGENITSRDGLCKNSEGVFNNDATKANVIIDQVQTEVYFGPENQLHSTPLLKNNKNHRDFLAKDTKEASESALGCANSFQIHDAVKSSKNFIDDPIGSTVYTSSIDTKNHLLSGNSDASEYSDSNTSYDREVNVRSESCRSTLGQNKTASCNRDPKDYIESENLLIDDNVVQPNNSVTSELNTEACAKKLSFLCDRTVPEQNSAISECYLEIDAESESLFGNNSAALQQSGSSVTEYDQEVDTKSDSSFGPTSEVDSEFKVGTKSESLFGNNSALQQNNISTSEYDPEVDTKSDSSLSSLTHENDPEFNVVAKSELLIHDAATQQNNKDKSNCNLEVCGRIYFSIINATTDERGSKPYRCDVDTQCESVIDERSEDISVMCHYGQKTGSSGRALQVENNPLNAIEQCISARIDDVICYTKTERRDQEQNFLLHDQVAQSKTQNRDLISSSEYKNSSNVLQCNVDHKEPEVCYDSRVEGLQEYKEKGKACIVEYDRSYDFVNEPDGKPKAATCLDYEEHHHDDGICENLFTNNLLFDEKMPGDKCDCQPKEIIPQTVDINYNRHFERRSKDKTSRGRCMKHCSTEEEQLKGSNFVEIVKETFLQCSGHTDASTYSELTSNSCEVFSSSKCGSNNCIDLCSPSEDETSERRLCSEFSHHEKPSNSTYKSFSDNSSLCKFHSAKTFIEISSSSECKISEKNTVEIDCSHSDDISISSPSLTRSRNESMPYDPENVSPVDILTSPQCFDNMSLATPSTGTVESCSAFFTQPEDPEKQSHLEQEVHDPTLVECESDMSLATQSLTTIGYTPTDHFLSSEDEEGSTTGTKSYSNAVVTTSKTSNSITQIPGNYSNQDIISSGNEGDNEISTGISSPESLPTKKSPKLVNRNTNNLSLGKLVQKTKGLLQRRHSYKTHDLGLSSPDSIRTQTEVCSPEVFVPLEGFYPSGISADVLFKRNKAEAQFNNKSNSIVELLSSDLTSIYVDSDYNPESFVPLLSSRSCNLQQEKRKSKGRLSRFEGEHQESLNISCTTVSHESSNNLEKNCGRFRSFDYRYSNAEENGDFIQSSPSTKLCTKAPMELSSISSPEQSLRDKTTCLISAMKKATKGYERYSETRKDSPYNCLNELKAVTQSFDNSKYEDKEYINDTLVDEGREFLERVLDEQNSNEVLLDEGHDLLELALEESIQKNSVKNIEMQETRDTMESKRSISTAESVKGAVFDCVVNSDNHKLSVIDAEQNGDSQQQPERWAEQKSAIEIGEDLSECIKIIHDKAIESNPSTVFPNPDSICSLETASQNSNQAATPDSAPTNPATCTAVSSNEPQAHNDQSLLHETNKDNVAFSSTCLVESVQSVSSEKERTEISLDEFVDAELKKKNVKMKCPLSEHQEFGMRSSSSLCASLDPIVTASSEKDCPSASITQQPSVEPNIFNMDCGNFSRKPKNRRSPVNDPLNHSGVINDYKQKMITILQKRVDIEKAYREECDSALATVKMLVKKNKSTEEDLRGILQTRLCDIRQKYVSELQSFVRKETNSLQLTIENLTNE